MSVRCIFEVIIFFLFDLVFFFFMCFSVAVLQEKLLLAISSDSGFGTNEEEQQLNSIFN